MTEPNQKIRWRSFCALLVTAITLCSGCNLCCPPYMDDYATIGGKWQRAHPSEGVVGSAFSDPGVTMAGTYSSGHESAEVYHDGVYSEGEVIEPNHTSGMGSTEFYVGDEVIVDEASEGIIVFDE